MSARTIFDAVRNNGSVRFGLFVVGVALILVSPLAGLLPGPGGIIVFAVGLGLMLKNSAWAKRRYVAFKRRFPRPASLADWGMRRPSRKRRSMRAKSEAVKTD